MFASKLFLNKDFKEEPYYEIERKEISPNFYGLFALEDIPAMRIVGKFEPILLFKFDKRDLEHFGHFINPSGKVLSYMVNEVLLRNQDENTKAADAIENLTPRLSLEEFMDAADSSDFRSASWKNYNDKLDANKFSNGKIEFVFSLPSSMNHSCSPNCIFDFETGIMHTLKDVKEGDQLKIYYRLEGDFDEQRSNLKSCWEFDCDCGFCENPSSDVQSPIDYLYNDIYNKCHNCGSSFTSGINRAKPMFTCPKCNISRYCCKECLVNHYNTHEEICGLKSSIGAFHK